MLREDDLFFDFVLLILVLRIFLKFFLMLIIYFDEDLLILIEDGVLSWFLLFKFVEFDNIFFY